ncbi:MAG: 30S ribosomal protein S26e [Candidatus Njordarchaeota archaeon]
MPYKRKNRGRKKGRSPGRVGYVTCVMCGARVPEDKAIKRVVWGSTVGGNIAKELAAQGTLITTQRKVKYYCVRCAMYLGIVKIRPRDERKEIPEEMLEKRLRRIVGT